MQKAAIMIATAILLAGASEVLPAAKIEQQILVPAGEDFQYVVGPHGLHVAALGHKGSRRIVLLDGVPGPKLDGIAQAPGDHSPIGHVTFSDDGHHSAYVGTKAGEFLVFLDGQQIDTVDPKLMGTYAPELQFSPGGKHLFFHEYQDDSGQDGDVIVIDGKPGPLCVRDSDHHSNPVFSADDDHWAYVGAERMHHDTLFMVVDGTRMDFNGNIVQYAGNRLLLLQQTANGQRLLFGDKVLATAKDRIEVNGVSPDGNLVVSTVHDEQFGPGMLYLNDQPVAAAKAITGVDQVVFSADGHHYAAACKTDHNTAYVVTDGQPGEEYRAIRTTGPDLLLSPDGATVAYDGFNGQDYVVCNDFESDGDHSIGLLTLFDSTGHFAYIGGNNSNRLFVDGKLVNENFMGIRSFTVSPDGSRYAFATSQPKSTDVNLLMIDGKPVPNLIARPFGQISPAWEPRSQTDPRTQISCVFSPDGKHVAYFGGPPKSPRENEFFVDGQVVYSNKVPGWRGQVFEPVFTADSKHLYWVTVGKTPQQRTLYLDGAPVVDYADADVQRSDGGWEIDPDGSLRFLAVVDGNLDRYTVTPSDNTSVAGMLAASDGSATPGTAQNRS